MVYARLEISGDGSAELEDDGTIEVELSFDKATTPSLPVDANDFFNSLLVPRPIDNSHPGAMLWDLGSNVGLGSVIDTISRTWAASAWPSVIGDIRAATVPALSARATRSGQPSLSAKRSRRPHGGP